MKILHCFFFFILSLFIFSQGLGVHGLEYRDDEIFYFQSTQEMLETGDIWSPTYFGEDRFQKPILYYWLILLSYKIFGVGWVGARFVAVIFAALTICLTWLIAEKLFNKKTADLSSVILMTVPLFFRHAKNAVPDMPLNFFIVAAVYAFIQFIHHPEKKSLWSNVFFIMCGLGFMIKGFAAWIVPMGMILLYALLHWDATILKKIKFGRGFLMMLVIILPWFLLMIKMHGLKYLNYMIVEETQNRLLSQDHQGNVIFSYVKMFGSHMVFYIKNIFSYFAPWSLFIFLAIPFAVVHQRKKDRQGDSLQILLIWFFLVFLFFSSMYFVINHYMLVLSTPFAILISYFFLNFINIKSFSGRVLFIFQKYLILFILGAGCFIFSFVSVFLVESSQWWLVIFGFMYIIAFWFIHKSKNYLAAPMVLGTFILFVIAQSSILNRAGLTSHASLQRFAQRIHQEIEDESVIGVGSHDIHEKEFQAYFQRKIEKAATSDDGETKSRLTKLFNENEKVYCLITNKDFNHYFQQELKPKIVQEDYMMRKRMALDVNFFIALIKLDQKVVYEYLMEKVVLIKKG